MSRLNPSELWRAIILYGLNQASYKMALGKVLIERASLGVNEISWAELSVGFLDSYIERIEQTGMPQQATLGRQTKLERIVAQLKLEKINRDQAIEFVASEGFNDVVPRFQTIGTDKQIANEAFYEIQFGKRLIIKDALLDLSQIHTEEHIDEINARWGLLEGAFAINQSAQNLTLANDIRETFLRVGETKRANLTSNIPFLQGYQGNTCFYCGEKIKNTPHVDHVLPRQVVTHDQIWNLVLAHEECNLQKSDKIVGPHFIEKLVYRNENIMGSNHPWKRKIASDLGETKSKRISKTKSIYEDVKVARGEVYWGSSRAYDPSKDEFYRKFITVLNNGVRNA
jgi:3-dehydroquinate dehydratase